MKPIAIIGAGSFVGARLVERAELLGDMPIVPIVRSPRSQGRLARFGTPLVLGDAGDRASLVPLLKGCGMVVNLTLGDDRRILGDVQAMHAACQEAQVPLFVHMSSAEVFGRAQDPTLSDDSVADSPPLDGVRPRKKGGRSVVAIPVGGPRAGGHPAPGD